MPSLGLQKRLILHKKLHCPFTLLQMREVSGEILQQRDGSGDQSAF